MPIHRDRITEYLDQDEGDPPPVFVGHDTILDDILDTATRKAGRPKVTRIVQGAPGAGKSSLLHEMQKLWLGTDEKPRVVVLSSTHLLHDPRIGVGAVLDAWTMEKTKWKRTLADRSRRVSGFGVGPGGLSVRFSDERIPGTLREVASAYPATEHSVPLIVAVDEAQRFGRDQTSPEALFLQDIHDGSSGLPLLLVLAGLSDTAEKARGMHLTRGRKIHEVEPLTQAQARDFLCGLALYFGLDTASHTPRLEALADICDGWPRHLRYAGVSLAEETLRVDGNMHRMDWPAMRRMTWTLRQEYYSDQNSSSMKQADILTARVMAGLRDGMRTRHVEKLIEDSLADRPGQRLPEGKSALWFLNHLIHQGALYRAPDDGVHAPIPSFRSYLIEWGSEPDQTPARDVTEPDSGP